MQLQQTKTNFSASATSLGVTFSPKEIGNLLVVWASVFVPTATLSISDSVHTWTPITALTASVSDAAQMWYTYATVTSSITVTITQTGTTQFMAILGHEIDGIVATSPVDVFNSGTGSGSATLVVGTPTTNNSFILSCCSDLITAVGAGYSKAADDTQSDWSEYLTGGAELNGVAQTTSFVGSGTYNIHSVVLAGLPETAGGRVDDRWRARPSSFNLNGNASLTSAIGIRRVQWTDDAGVRNPSRDAVADLQPRIL